MAGVGAAGSSHGGSRPRTAPSTRETGWRVTTTDRSDQPRGNEPPDRSRAQARDDPGAQKDEGGKRDDGEDPDGKDGDGKDDDGGGPKKKKKKGLLHRPLLLGRWPRFSSRPS